MWGCMCGCNEGSVDQGDCACGCYEGSGVNKGRGVGKGKDREKREGGAEGGWASREGKKGRVKTPPQRSS